MSSVEDPPPATILIDGGDFPGTPSTPYPPHPSPHMQQVACTQSQPKERNQTKGLSKGTLEPHTASQACAKDTLSGSGRALQTRRPISGTRHPQGICSVTWATQPHAPQKCNMALCCKTQSPLHDPGWLVKAFFDQLHALGTPTSNLCPQRAGLSAQVPPRSHSHGLLLSPQQLLMNPTISLLPILLQSESPWRDCLLVTILLI